MMPDVAAYAPYIEAVFDTPEEEAQRIPFTIADRSARACDGFQVARAQAADGTRRHFDDPDAAIIDPEFTVNRSFSKAQRFRRVSGACGDHVLCFQW